jgi:Rad3-related DNA helicase
VLQTWALRIPTPQECGLPERFEKWRPAQEEALDWLLHDSNTPNAVTARLLGADPVKTRRVKALSAPVGFGKTAVVVAYALLTKRPTCFVTESRPLQDQYMDLFESVGMVDLRGRNNYECAMRDDFSCQEGYAARCPYKGTVACPSSQAEMRAAASPLVVTNYAKWTTSKMFGQGMSHFKQVVFDEGHEAPTALAGAVQITLNHREVTERLGMEFPSFSEAEEFVNWKAWAGGARAVCESELAKAKDALKFNPTSPRVRDYLHLRNLLKKLATLSTANPENWVSDEVKRGYQFDPVRFGKYAESTLLLGVPNILVVSGTLRPKTMFMMGIPNEAMEFKEFTSDFDPKRCPIYYVPTMRVDSRANDFSMLWVRLDQIAGRRRDRKGIVHTISFSRRDAVTASSRFVDSMLINEQGEATSEAVAEFRMAGPGTIFVTPSVGAGFDFPLRQCEWQFVAKIPFPDGRAKIHKARQEDDKEYGAYQAANKLQQAFGRGMRSREDQCENFICDDHMSWFVGRYRHLLSKSFHRFYKVIQTLPPPLPKL